MDDFPVIKEGDLLWEPSPETVAGANVTRFMEWLHAEKGLRFDDYPALWRWSTDDLEGFWGAVWDFFGIRSETGYGRVLADERMPGARWFPGATVNYAENALAQPDDRPAVISRSEVRPLEVVDLRAVAGAGGRRRGGPQAVGRRAGRQGGGVHAQHPRGAGRLPGGVQHRGGVVGLLAGVRDAHGGGPVPADRAEGPDSGGPATSTAGAVSTAPRRSRR